MNNIKRVKSLFFFLTFFAVLFIFPNFSNALTISPPRLELKGNPGEIIKENLTLTNDKDVSQQFFLSFENFEAQGESGDPSFVPAEEGLGTWMNADPMVTLAPGESKIVPFTINIPKNAEAGGHFASIFWGTSPSMKGGGQVSVSAKVGTLILLSVSGDIKEEAGLLSFNTLNNIFWYKTLPVSFEYRFKNDGNDRIKPVGKAVIRNTLFIPTEKINPNVTSGNILPGSTRKYNFEWIEYKRPDGYISREGALGKYWENVKYEWKNFAVGLYSTKLKLEYGTQGQKVSKVVFFFVFPWELVIVMLLVIGIVFFGGKKLLRRYNKHIIEKARNSSKL